MREDYAIHCYFLWKFADLKRPALPQLRNVKSGRRKLRDTITIPRKLWIGAAIIGVFVCALMGAQIFPQTLPP